MNYWFGRYSEFFFGIFRIVAGLLFACHGAQKLFGVLGGQGPVSDPLLVAAGIIEFFGGLLIALGLGVGYVAFIASGEMAYAYFHAHAAQSFWPIVNRGEPAVLYCFLFLFMAFRGGGKFSLDAIIGGRKKPDAG